MTVTVFLSIPEHPYLRHVVKHKRSLQNLSSVLGMLKEAKNSSSVLIYLSKQCVHA